jgi:hypothetical protein
MESLNLKAVILTVLILTDISFAGTYSGGFGTEADPYQIGTVSDWQELMADSNDWDANFIMIADINLQGESLIPVGGMSPNGISMPSFKGIFDGNGHVIRNASINFPSYWHIGLFGVIDYNSIVKNLGVEDANMVCERDMGGLAGLSQGIIINCYATGKMGQPRYGTNCGGLVGLNRGLIKDCHADCDINNTSCTGGLVGRMEGGTIIDSYAEGNVYGFDDIGGLLGWNRGYTDEMGTIYFCTITNCYSNASVAGVQNVGGLIGSNTDADLTVLPTYSVTNCYAIGSVTGGSSVGGLIGSSGRGPITNCHASGAVTGNYSVGGLIGGASGLISNCFATGPVSGREDDTGKYIGQGIGGLMGSNGGLVKDCYATGIVTSLGNRSSYAGGLIGYHTGTVNTSLAEGSVTGYIYVGGLVGTNGIRGTTTPLSLIKDCYATGEVNGFIYIGGLAGYNNSNGIANCYSAGFVVGDHNAGGLIGFGNYSPNNCFWDINTSGKTISAGGTGLTTAQMKTISTFKSVGWDFVDETANGYGDIWRLCNEGLEYPKLSWQYMPGDIVCSDGVDAADLAEFCNQWLFIKLTYDLSPSGGDGIVNFEDFSVFASQWNRRKNINDLIIFTEQWLKAGLPVCSADISTDGHVDFVDFELMADNWLKGL